MLFGERLKVSNLSTFIPIPQTYPPVTYNLSIVYFHSSATVSISFSNHYYVLLLVLRNPPNHYTGPLVYQTN